MPMDGEVSPSPPLPYATVTILVRCSFIEPEGLSSMEPAEEDEDDNTQVI